MAQHPLVIVSDITTFFSMIKAIVKGRYKTPWKTVFWIVLCTLYFLFPVDVLPDILPILGFADDGAFIVFVLLLIHQDLVAFRQYQQQQASIIEAEVINEEPKK